MPPLLFSCCQSMSALAMAHTSLGDAGVLLVDLVGPSFAAHFIPALLEAFPVGLSLLAHDVFDYKRDCHIGERGGRTLLCGRGRP